MLANFNNNNVGRKAHTTKEENMETIKIKEFLELIEDYKGPINTEIKDDQKAEKVWSIINDLENELEGLVK
jgi:hypothetical protein